MAIHRDVDLSHCLARELRRIPGLELKKDEPLSRHTSFGIGGPADLLVIPSSPRELCEALAGTREAGVEPLILGNGTNLIDSSCQIRFKSLIPGVFAHTKNLTKADFPEEPG